MKKIILIILIVFLSTIVSSEIKYKISGKILKNNQPITNFKIIVKSKSNYKSISLIPDKNGFYYIYLTPGDYRIDCEQIEQVNTNNMYDVIVLGPDEITVKNKNIKGINFNLYDYIEVIEQNLNILNGIPSGTSHVIYKWGKVPNHSKDECRIFAEDFKSLVIDEMPSEIVPYLVIGNPVIFYDLINNPVYYEYPVVYTKMNIQVGYFGIKSIGLEPDIGPDMIALEIDSKNDPRLLEYRKGGVLTSNGLIPRLLNEISAEKGINVNSIGVEKLIFNGYSTEVLFKVTSTNELILANFSSLKWETVNLDFLQTIQDSYEIDTTLEFIVDYKEKNGLPIIE